MQTLTFDGDDCPCKGRILRIDAEEPEMKHEEEQVVEREEGEEFYVL
ncbi:MAG: hypothetical protein Q7R81_02570 [Candidatus Peregrinibacteria bacterium]|nr:hypothetical protein [Candidatus Peregrinibacteria bacterium]